MSALIASTSPKLLEWQNHTAASIVESHMNTSEKPRQPGTPMISSEAMIGIGITVLELGVLCLLLASAEYLRSVPRIALIWFVLGAILVILGGLTAASAKSRDRR
jgi:hypothetical protein